MSDGAISQDEIDALLAGVDMGGFGSSSSSNSSQADVDTGSIEKLVCDLTENLKNNLNTMSGTEFEIGKPLVYRYQLCTVLQINAGCFLRQQLLNCFVKIYLFLFIHTGQCLCK